MNRITALFFLFVPIFMYGQEVKNGSFIMDFSKKKKHQDTIQQQQSPADTIGDTPKPRREKKVKVQSTKSPSAPVPDFKAGGIFKALFHAGINACQIDGDNDWGYTYIGAETGAGALARFSRLFSISLELNYSMEGARATFASSVNNTNRYLVEWDYVQDPVALNAHYKQFLMISLGMAPEYMVRYKELNDDGTNVTSDPVLGQPRRFGLEGFAAMHFIIKRNYAIGLKYAYSAIKIRGAYSGTHVNGEYNNYITLRFMYILDTVRKKK
jgi:hypothetical protein